MTCTCSGWILYREKMTECEKNYRFLQQISTKNTNFNASKGKGFSLDARHSRKSAKCSSQNM